MLKNIIILCGGISNERDISLKSGYYALRSLRELRIKSAIFDLKKINLNDVMKYRLNTIVFITLHGSPGEDGSIQGLLELLGIEYFGSDIFSSFLCINKKKTKTLLNKYNILNPKSYKTCNFITNGIFPAILKPNDSGSSIGIKKLNKVKDLLNMKVLKDESFFIEKLITGKEFSVCMLKKNILPIIEIKLNGNVFDYKSKYMSKKNNIICPAKIETLQEKYLYDLSIKIFKILKVKDYGRIDFIKDKKGYFWCLETNTLPGISKNSLFITSSKVSGICITNLVLIILIDRIKKIYIK